MERHVTNLVARVSPSLVAVQVGEIIGSGVVVSTNGLVLTAAHVAERPNRRVMFTFPDGRRAKGVTLGTRHDADAGMMQITDSGDWPAVAVGDSALPSVGSWVLTLGHPGGFDPQRSVVARLGRVLRRDEDAIQSDCTIATGDSGGPLFDMDGRVVGVHSFIRASALENYHIPMKPFLDGWARLLASDNWGADAPSPRPTIGVRGVDLASGDEGCRLERVDESGSGYKAGLRVGDVIVGVNSKPLPNAASLRQSVVATEPGKDIEIEILRDGVRQTFRVTVQDRNSTR